MKIAFFCLNHSNKFSGGRMHALMAAEALALKNNVDFYSTAKPIFWNDFATINNHKNIKLIIDIFMRTQNKRYDIIIIVPHLSTKKLRLYDKFIFYPQIQRTIKKNSNSKVFFIDFESPNWVEEVLPGLRPPKLYKYSNYIIKYVNSIISTTALGRKYAKEYYSMLNANLKYHQVYLGINSHIASQYSIAQKENSFIIIIRGGSHKNSQTIFNIVKCIPPYYKIYFIGKKNVLDNKTLNEVKDYANNTSIELVYEGVVSENRKYEIFSKTKCLFFPSKFEGYGLPPVEAQYMGNHVICSNIPVLKEVNPYAHFIKNFEDQNEIKDSIQQVLKSTATSFEIRKRVEHFANISSFRKNLEKIITSD